MLVCDAETPKAAAAMNVRVGQLSDGDEFPGLAHFCEHMLFLGTAKYPSENEYQARRPRVRARRGAHAHFSERAALLGACVLYGAVF